MIPMDRHVALVTTTVRATNSGLRWQRIDLGDDQWISVREDGAFHAHGLGPAVNCFGMTKATVGPWPTWTIEGRTAERCPVCGAPKYVDEPCTEPHTPPVDYPREDEPMAAPYPYPGCCEHGVNAHDRTHCLACGCVKPAVQVSPPAPEPADTGSGDEPWGVRANLHSCGTCHALVLDEEREAHIDVHDREIKRIADILTALARLSRSEP